MTEQQLLKLSDSIITKVKNDLVLGASNKKSDRIRTRNFSCMGIIAARYNYSYHKTATGYTLFVPKQEKYIDADYTIKKSQQTAEALANRAGNCRETSNLGMYYALLSESHNLINITIINLSPIDHSFILISDKLSNAQVICDPWLEFSQPYNETNFTKFREEIANEYVYSNSHYKKNSNIIAILRNLVFPLRMQSLINIKDQKQRNLFLSNVEITYKDIIYSASLQADRITHKKTFAAVIKQIGLLQSTHTSILAANSNNDEASTVQSADNPSIA